MPSIDFQRNNLDRATSPYLQQHKENPIHWQEWNQETLDHARKQGTLLFVSIGYATCHWCHVMAKDSFSDEEVAEILNKHFISIKVDREQRPDLDQYFIAYVTEKTGSAGWPLNIILTPKGTPLFGGTYFLPTSRLGVPSFKDVLRQVVQRYREHGEAVEGFTMPREEETRLAEDEIVTFIHRAFDKTWGGFGFGTKFPPHSTLLFLTTLSGETQSEDVTVMIRKTLDVMAQRGLHDHLQGGFYRYCMDREWTIPHFEKMLYDQAMLLWNYSLAFQLFGDSLYKTVTQKLLQCLEETFEDNGLYQSAHDADTDHEEGGTYLWEYRELKDLLSSKELEEFSRVYELSKSGSFEGKNHLIKKGTEFLPEIEKKLLKVREKRAQPFTDRKIVTSWNALLGSALLMHARAVGEGHSREKATQLFEKLLKCHYREGKLVHSSLGESMQEQGFLEDYASMLLFATYLYEETWEESYKEVIGTLLRSMKTFEDDDRWHENEAGGDFQRIHANVLDHPTPSSIALAEFAQYRAHRILGSDERTQLQFKQPLESDFYNVVVFLMQGHCHEISAMERIEWNLLPVNSMQLPGRDYQDCYHQQCQKFSSKEELLSHLGSM